MVQVVRHIESWNVSGTEALLQILRPSSGQERSSTSPKASHQADLFWYDLEESSMVRSAVILKKVRIRK